MTATASLTAITSDGPARPAHHVTVYLSADVPVAHLLPRAFRHVDTTTDRQVFAATIQTRTPATLADRVERHLETLLAAHGVPCLIEAVVESPTIAAAPTQPSLPWPRPGRPLRARVADDRVQAIVRLRRDGHTLQDIADRYGISRERVRQLVNAHGGPTAHTVRRDRNARRHAADQALARAVRAHITRNPGQTIEDVAAALDITEAAVRSALGADGRRLLVRKAHGPARIPNERLLEEIRWAAAMVAGPLTGKAYDHAASVLGLHSRVLILQRLDTWVHACELAGVTPGQAVRDNYRRRWDRDQMLDHVAAYLAEPGSRGTYDGYADYARRTPGAPSAQTVRNSIGTWATIKTEAFRHAAADAGSTRRVA